MGWTEAQRRRLSAEKAVLQKNFPGRVKWINPTGDTKVEVEVNTNNGKSYSLRIYLNADFPHSVPEMVVSKSPNPMPDWCTSYKNHTLSKRDGFVNIICHYRSEYWTSQLSLYEVFIKGRIWLEAHEGHLRTGQSMDYFLREMPAQLVWQRIGRLVERYECVIQ